MILDKAKFGLIALGISLSILAPALLLTCASQARAEAGAPGDSSSEQKAIRDQISGLEKALANGDSKALAALWTEDGLYVDADGNTSRGKEAIEKRFTTLFKLKGAQPFQLTPDAVQMVSPDVARADGLVKSKENSSAQPETRFLLFFTKNSGVWLITSASEIPLVQPIKKDSLSDLNWMLGKWKAERNGNSVEMTAELLPSKQFISCSYEINRTGHPIDHEYQIIGVDPGKGQISFWSFLSNGGVGTGTWFKQNGEWLVEAMATEPDGSVSRATNLIDPSDPNSFVWQSIDRSINGVAVVDSLPLKVDRINQ
jgi:uncharacterized protein (TIGR02246 family)